MRKVISVVASSPGADARRICPKTQTQSGSKSIALFVETRVEVLKEAR